MIHDDPHRWHDPHKLETMEAWPPPFIMLMGTNDGYEPLTAQQVDDIHGYLAARIRASCPDAEIVMYNPLRGRGLVHPASRVGRERKS